MERRIREAIRYLGIGKNAADDRTYAMVAEAFEKLRQEASPRSTCRIFEMKLCDNGIIKIGKLEIESSSLRRNLAGCDRIVLFGATLGMEVDRMIARAEIKDMAEAVVLQACAAAFLEEFCDEKQEEIGRELEAEARYLRPRFSPGYGDFDIRYQEPVMRMLDCAKTIGLTMTDGYMMTPSKSVTAVIGASPVQERCPVHGCEACGKKDCLYRR